MSMKGIFNQNSKKTRNDVNEFEQQILRINALEVHMKNLLKFEKQVRTFMLGMGRGEKEENPWIERKNEVNKKSQIKGPSLENFEKTQKCDLCDKKLNELTGRLNKFEQSVREIILSVNTSQTTSLSVEEEQEREGRLLHLVERRLSEKLATHIKKQEMMQEKVGSLESLILKLMERENHQFNGFSKEERINQSILEGIAVIGSPCDGDELEEADVESFDSHIKMRVLALENNYLLVNEVQAGLLKRVDNLIEKCNELTKKMVETEDVTMQQDSICNTLYIDKLYLDKYEQNNNFAQLGINHLSGALNIGATYGRDVVPKKITEQVKEDLAKMKTVKEEMEKNHTSAEKQTDSQNNESSSYVNSIPPEEDIPYTDIVIEDDPSLGENPF
ncbi:hypothetical protein ACSU6B_08350 [Neobacillus sp. C211]|uniref:hypothetical protein n=1 Tax=unclassified Neobacillus TaxID=2675272 RepID=UPI00397A4A6E